MTQPWDADPLRRSIDRTLAAHAPIGAPSTWVLSNHDVTRPVTRYGREDSSFAFLTKRQGIPSDLELGRRRARAAALLVAALPGALYIYQGDELGLDEVTDLPPEQIQDPMHFRSGGVDPGRDGCRVPLPWSGDRAPFGFSPDGAAQPTWLRQPAHWRDMTVAAQEADHDSMLWLYRDVLRLRRADADLGDGALTWRTSAPGVLDFSRGDHFRCIANLSPAAVALPPDATLLLASAPVRDGLLPVDGTAWLRQDTERGHG